MNTRQGGAAVAEPTPIAALRRALDLAQPVGNGVEVIADARKALERVEAVYGKAKALAEKLAEIHEDVIHGGTGSSYTAELSELRVALAGKEGP